MAPSRTGAFVQFPHGTKKGLAYANPFFYMVEAVGIGLRSATSCLLAQPRSFSLPAASCRLFLALLGAQKPFDSNTSRI